METTKRRKRRRQGKSEPSLTFLIPESARGRVVPTDYLFTGLTKGVQGRRQYGVTRPGEFDPRIVLVGRRRTCEVSHLRNVKDPFFRISVWYRGEGNVDVVMSMTEMTGTRPLPRSPDQYSVRGGRMTSVVCLSSSKREGTLGSGQ